MDISSKLLNNRVTQTQRQALQNAFGRPPLEIRIELVLPKLPARSGSVPNTARA